MKRAELLRQVRARLREAFGNRLHGIILYGSEARGDAREDSDIDILMLLEGPVDLGQDIDVSVQALYPLMLQIGRTIDALPVDVENYEAGLMAVYREAKQEGIQA